MTNPLVETLEVASIGWLRHTTKNSIAGVHPENFVLGWQRHSNTNLFVSNIFGYVDERKKWQH
jgi:hypothetical protein